MLHRHCTDQLSLLRALRPLLSAVGGVGRAARLHSVPDSELEPNQVAWLRELQRSAERLAAAAGGASGGDQAPQGAAAGTDTQQIDSQAAMSSFDSAAAAAAEVPVEQQRLLQAGVVGVPNAGKSTLVNALVGRKVTAVSPKTNTTEQMRLGAFTEGVSQVVLYDTPGVVDKQHYKNPAHQRRVHNAWAAAGDCDLLLFLVDAARQLKRPDPRVVRTIATSSSAAALGLSLPAGWEPPPAVLVLNKVDAVPRGERRLLLPLAEQLQGLRRFEDVFFVSAKHGRGLPELRQYLLDRATPGEWTLEAGQATDRPEEEQAVEVVREALFVRLYKEVPYQLSLRATSCLPLEDGSVRIEMDVLAPTPSMKKIVVGSGGANIAAVGSRAQADLEHMWGHPVHLQLQVRVDRAA